MKRAAELLQTSPTTVSRHIREMSRDCDTMLVRQIKGGDWKLTPAGVRLVEMAADFKAKLSALSETDDHEASETISITSVDFILTYHLAQHLFSLKAMMPDQSLSLVASEKRLSLAYGEADIALRFGRPDEGSLISKRLVNIPFWIWQPPHVFTDQWVGLTEDADWTPDMQSAHEYFGRPPAFRVASYAAMKRAALGLGYAAVGPISVFEGSGMIVDPTSAPTLRGLWLVHHESRKYDKSLQNVKAWLEATFRKQLPAMSLVKAQSG